MKDLLSLLLLVFIIGIFLVGCSKEVVENKREVEKIVPTGLTNEIGEGNIIVTTPISTSENETTPIVYVDEYKGLAQLGFQSKGFDDSRLSYIYIDGKLNTIEELGDVNSITLTICEDDLKEGIHKIEVIQFDNDKTDGTPITYKACNYKIDKR